MFKKILFQLHWFMGITAGLILSIMGITGAIYSYDQQILKWINQDSYYVDVQPQEKLTPQQLYLHFSKQDENIKINSITIAKDPAASSTVNIAKEGERRGYNMMVNPYTAEILPDIKGREFFQFIQRLHRYLTMGDFGKQLTGASVLMLIYFVLSGIYLRWPKKHSVKQWLFVKPKLKGRNFIWDLHAVVGTWVIVFYLIFAVTGLYWSYDWWRSGMFKVLGVERPQQMQQGGSGGGQQRPENRIASQGQTGQRSAVEQRIQPQENRNPRNQEQQLHGANTNNPMQGNNHQNREREHEAKLTSEQTSNILNVSWTGLQQNLKQDYSSITLNIPKKADNLIELSFVDVIPQHERARNNAKYNYQKQSVEELELYRDKKLNEKIMSSMLPVHRGSFMGPIFQFFAMLASLAMPLFFVTGWMLYLKRRKQKKLTLAARQSSNVISIDPHAEQWTILYASQTGMAEQIAYNTSSALQQAGVPTQVKALKECTLSDINHFSQVLFIVSTYGTGDAPDLATGFVKKFMSEAASFDTLKFAVLALGSKEYPETYCTFGHKLNTWLKNSNAQPVFNIVEVDNGNKTDLERWYTALSSITHKQIDAVISEKTFDHWQLMQRHILNPESIAEYAYEIQLKPLHGETWHAGDIAEIRPANDKERIAHFIETSQLENNDETYQTLLYKDLSHITSISSQSITELPDLPSREYSIASIPADGYVQLVVRQKKIGDGYGLGSGWLTVYAETANKLLVRIRTNSSFHLIDDNRPAIFIGNGTGIAGLLSLLKQRQQLGYHDNWLVFGERQRQADYFYQQQIEQWVESQHLQHLDLAFSRDQVERVYVQEKLIEQQQRLKEWIARDAVIYVCGSIDGMASGVEQALNLILGEALVNELRQNDRYRRDVY